MGASGFFSVDAIVSVIPILLMIIFTMEAYAFTIRQADKAAQSQELFDKLVSVADYTVNTGAIQDNEANWLDPSSLNDRYSGNLGSRAGISRLYISLSSPDENNQRFDICIYRMVVIGWKRQISKLFICGDYANG